MLLLVVFAPLAAGLLTLALPTRATLLRVLLATAGPVASCVLLGLYMARHGVAGGRVSLAWMPGLHLDWAFNADPLGLFFASLVSGIGVLILLYARAYLGPDGPALRRFYPLMSLFMSAMLGLVLADDFLLMLLFWELTSISSFLLIGWDYEDRTAVKNALQAFVTTGTGGLALFGGLVLLGVTTGAWSFTALQSPLASGAVVGAFCLIYLGVAAKSAQWPLHYWLPGAMLAPTPISAYLHSAAMVKAGIYLLARLWPDLSHLTIWPAIIISIGGFTMVFAAFVAVQRDVLKQILAYTTISQLGLLAAAFGLAHYRHEGEPNLIWGNGQILNHALYKAPLFILAGGTAHALGAKALSDLRGAWHRGGSWRLYAVLFLLAAAGLAALPGTFSFFMKEAFLYQVWHALHDGGSKLLWLLVIAAVCTSAFNVAIFCRFAQTFFGHGTVGVAHSDGEAALAAGSGLTDRNPAAKAASPTPSEPEAHHHAHDSAFWAAMLWLPAALLIALQLFGGLAGPVFAGLLKPVESSPFYFEPRDISLLHVALHPSVPLLLSGIGIALGLFVGLGPILRRVQSDPHDKLFPLAYGLIVRGGGRLFALFQNGRLRWYVLASFACLVAIIAWSGHVSFWGGYERFAWPTDGTALPSITKYPAAWTLCGLISLGAILLVFVRDRATRVLILGSVGFSVTGMFYVYHAPDLAITQLSVEIVSLILFLLVLNLLPRESPGDRSLLWLRLPAAVAVGLVGFGVTLYSATGDRPPRPATLADAAAPATLGDWFLRNSYVGTDTAFVPRDLAGGGTVDRGAAHADSFGSHPPHGEHAGPDTVTLHKGGGGNNVVNVVVVDQRGYDTMGEITVLCIAAMGVWTLLRQPPTSRDEAETDNRSTPYDDTFAGVAEAPRAGRAVPAELLATPILQTAVRLLIPLAVVFSAYLYFKGHQTPGGGFVGGLATAVALLVYRMCFGCDALYKLMPVRERTLLAVGLTLAVGTGVVALLAGLPMLTTNNGYLHLPGGGTFHWASVAVFDLGVYLVVVGSFVGMIDALARELE